MKLEQVSVGRYHQHILLTAVSSFQWLNCKMSVHELELEFKIEECIREIKSPFNSSPERMNIESPLTAPQRR